MSRQPILPKDKKNPNQTTRLEAGATNMFSSKVREINREVVKIVKSLDYTVTTINAAKAKRSDLSFVRSWGYDRLNDKAYPVYKNALITNAEKRYNYDLSSSEILRLGDTIEEIVDRIMMTTMHDQFGNVQYVQKSNASQLWLFSGFVEPAYKKGTNAAFRNLSVQSDQYADDVDSVRQLFSTDAYQFRIQALAAREFELMEGFNADTVKDARRILSDGIATGRSPKALARELTQRVGVNEYRGRRIAQTEINVAHRRSRQAESIRAMESYDIKIMALWVSALKSTTRISHGSRHGKLYTWEQVNEFYSKNGNAIFCYCTQTEQVVDEDNKPINTGAIEILEKQREEFSIAA